VCAAGSKVPNGSRPPPHSRPTRATCSGSTSAPPVPTTSPITSAPNPPRPDQTAGRPSLTACRCSVGSTSSPARSSPSTGPAGLRYGLPRWTDTSNAGSADLAAPPPGRETHPPQRGTLMRPAGRRPPATHRKRHASTLQYRYLHRWHQSLHRWHSRRWDYPPIRSTSRSGLPRLNRLHQTGGRSRSQPISGQSHECVHDGGLPSGRDVSSGWERPRVCRLWRLCSGRPVRGGG
jgi:hypothetical protein